MGMVCCVQNVQDNISERSPDAVANGNPRDNHSAAEPDAEYDYSKSLVNFPTELLIKILSYLPTRDRVMTRYVSRRFRDVSDVPLLWKEFVWRDYEPRHVCSVMKMLKEHGEYVRRIFFPAHLTTTKVLEMACHCTQVTHLSLPRDTQLTLDDLKRVVRTTTCLHQLDVFAEGNFMQRDNIQLHIIGLLEITATSVKELKLHVNKFSHAIIGSIRAVANQGFSLPVINIFADYATFGLFGLWSHMRSDCERSWSFEINVYHFKRIALHLYPVVPLKRLHFGPSVAPPFIQLSKYGIVGLKLDVFYLNQYDHDGTVRHTVTPVVSKFIRNIPNIPINYTSDLHYVSYIDVSKLYVRSSHLEQLAVVCPNLQRLNLKDNVDCLKDLRGLHAIVNTCQNLEGLNVTGISLSQVESYLLLWELLSSLKKLTHLAIDLCLMKPDDANKQKLISMFKSFQSLKALEISRDYIKGCMECTNTTDFLFSYFPSLVYCRMYCFRYSALTYAITNCHKLKYLYERDARKESLLPLSNNCRLQQLCIYSVSLNLTDELVEVLSAHGQLECVVLYVKSITINGLTILINNLPKLTSLHISMIEPLFEDSYTFRREVTHAHACACGVTPRIKKAVDQPYTYTDRVKNMFSYRKLFDGDNFSVHVIAGTMIQGMLDGDLADTELNSLWPLLEPYTF